MDAMPSIGVLPDETLELIFSKLSVSDRKSVRLVNRHWLSVCNSTSVTKHELLALDPGESLQVVKIPRGCLNLQFFDSKADENSEEEDEFWPNHGSSIRSLEVTNFQLKGPVLDKIIDHCSTLTTLTLEFSKRYSRLKWGADSDDSDSDDMFDDFDDCVSDDYSFDDILNDLVDRPGENNEGPKLDSLQSLTFIGQHTLPYITGTAFIRLTQSVPSLKKLTFTDIYTGTPSYKEEILKLVARQASTLTELEFWGSNFVSDKFLDNLLELIGPQLTLLRLRFVWVRNIGWIKKHLNKLSNLQKLILNGRSFNFRGDDSLSCLVHLRNLKYISLADTNLCDEDLLSLDKLDQVKTLDLRFTDCLSDRIFKSFRRRMEYNSMEVQ